MGTVGPIYVECSKQSTNLRHNLVLIAYLLVSMLEVFFRGAHFDVCLE